MSLHTMAHPHSTPPYHTAPHATQKVLSLPLGVKGEVTLHAAMVKAAGVKKNKLLLINNSGWRHRTGINEMVGAKFATSGGGTGTANAYAVGRARTAVDEPYQFQVARAKFVLCPSGMGWDTYRHWEVLLMGSIPVMESSPG